LTWKDRLSSVLDYVCVVGVILELVPAAQVGLVAGSLRNCAFDRSSYISSEYVSISAPKNRAQVECYHSRELL
jgi:hypothetical protein